MCNVIGFAFESENEKKNCISENNVAYWGKKSKDNVVFSKSTLKTSLKHLKQNCYFMVHNSLLRQKIGIPLGIDPTPFWANLFLNTYEHDYMSELIWNDKVKVRHFHTTKRFIDGLGTLNDVGIFNDVYKYIHSPELQLKVENSGTHATFLSSDITVKDVVFVYKLLDKLDALPFLSFASFRMIVTSPNQCFILFLLVNFLE